MDEVVSSLSPERWRALDPAWGLRGLSATPFWGFLVGGFFLYMSYYGADQSQVQRELSATSIEDTRRSLYLNGFARFPLTLGYVVMGVVLGAFFGISADLQEQVPPERLDFLVPAFILQEVPAGIRGLLIAALLAASMSSLDSALNSLSAATMRDFVERGRALSRRRILIYSKLSTIVWGVVITGFAFTVGGISDTVIESINKIGSTFYGPILAAFLVGVLSSTATAPGIFAGVLCGVGFNLALWLFLPEVFWMWWNFTGLVIAIVVTALVSRARGRVDPEVIRRYTLSGSGFYGQERLWRPAYTLLVVYFLALLGLLLLLNRVAEGLSAG
jgi:SSS family solute:Na+ symporter